MTGLTRRRLLTGLGVATPALILGYSGLLPVREAKKAFLQSGERLSFAARNLVGRNALAREFTKADLSPHFRTNGTTEPDTEEWQRAARNGFADWKLKVDGAVQSPHAFSLAELKSLPARTQITRHDCVEGWSAIAEWTGTPLSALLDQVRLASEARYVVFWCADVIRGWQYYESIDLIDAYHPQTILAYRMNGQPLPKGHGAPVRLRVERQLGYKQAKFVMRIEAVTTLENTRYGGGGFWEDAGGYEWYAGI